MQPWENIKRHKVKRYGLKNSTSYEVRQVCLHFFTISLSLSPKSAKKNLQPFWPTKIILYFSTTANQLSVTSVPNDSAKPALRLVNFAEALYKAKKSERNLSFFMSVYIFINSFRTCTAREDMNYGSFG